MKRIKISVLLNVVLVIIIIGLGVFGYFYFTKTDPTENFTPPAVLRKGSPPVFNFAIYGDIKNKNILSDPLDVLEVDRKIYISDGGNDRVLIFDYSGNLINSFGKTGKYKLYYPYGLASDGTYIYVADKNKYIYRAKLDGSDLEPFLTPDQTEMGRPGGLDIDKGRLYATDIHKSKLVAFDLNTKKKLFTVGEPGKGKGQMTYPNNVAVSSKGEIYVSDSNNSRIQVFNSEGEFLRTVGSKGDGSGKILIVRGLAFDKEGNLYATAGLADKIVIMDKEGEIVMDFGNKSQTQNENISLPNGLAIGEKGRIYITESGTNRVSVFIPQ